MSAPLHPADPSPARVWQANPFALLANPPGGGALMIWVGLFLVLGSVGHDPWKGDDATHFGVVWSMLQHGFSMVPTLAGEPYLDLPPLYHWVAAGLAEVLGWLLLAPDASRLASGAFAAVLLASIGLSAQRWHGLAANTPAVLLGMGSLGLLVHSHENQPMMAVAAFAAIGYLGFAWLDRRAMQGGLLACLGLSGVVLSGGFWAACLLAPLWVLAPICHEGLRNRASLSALVLSALGATGIFALYAGALYTTDPGVFQQAWVQGVDKVLRPVGRLEALPDWFKMFAWFAWPAWPLAGWALWCSRRYWATPAFRLPLLYLALALAAVLVFAEQRSASALPLIAPLVLVAVPGLPGLRRGAANAFDWFAMMTFTLLAGAVWFAWNTLALGQPSRFAATLERLAPEFVFQFSLPATGLALLLTFAWIWLLINSPRSPYRGVTHFAAGVLVFWALVACLLQNWIDYGKSYRSVMTTLSQILQAAPPGCLAGRDLGSSQRALLDYFVNLQARSGAEAESTCTRLLVQSTRSRPDAPPGDPWVLRWEGSRPGDRHEVLRLYVRS